MSCTIGTSGVVFAYLEKPAYDPAGRVHTFCHAVRGAWHVMGVTQGAGLSLQWFRNRFAPDAAYDDLTTDATLSPAGAHGLFWLPYLMGERTPHLDASARAAWVGLTAKHQRADLVRAILEGVCFSQKDGLEIINGLGARPDLVRLSGGGAKSPFWHQLFADIFNERVVTLETQEGSAYGAALLALVGTGEYSSVLKYVRRRCAKPRQKRPIRRRPIFTSVAMPSIARSIRRSSPRLKPSANSMVDELPRYCEVAVPVPVDRLFTYELPLTLRHRVLAGCRVQVPFGSRTLTGVVLRTHAQSVAQEVRQVSALRDEEPVLDRDLLDLASWIAEYYCAPIGEVLKGMLPLSGETRRSTRYTLTDSGRQVARQLILRPDSDPASRLLGLLEERPRALSYLASKVDKPRQRAAAACSAWLGRGRRKRRRKESAACCGRTSAG